MSLNDVVARNLKRLRNERNLSLSALAERSGVSKVMISQIERGESSPTINTLWKIATGLQVSYTKLIDELVEAPALIRKGESTLVEDQGYRVFHYGTTNPAREFEFFNSELEGGCFFASEGHAINTHEYLLVTAGELVLIYGAEEYILHQGDFVHFDCAKPHTYENRTTEVAVFTNIVYYD